MRSYPPRPAPHAHRNGVTRSRIAVEKNNVARFGLLFAQLQAQAHPFHLAFRLTSLQRVPGPPPAELFFRKALDSCERLMRTPSRASISARRRGIVQLRRSATGSASKGVTTRKAASLVLGGGPRAMLVFNAATPPAVKSLRRRRTVSSRTPNASAILELVQPASVKSTARARSASLRSRESARPTGARPAPMHIETASRLPGSSQCSACRSLASAVRGREYRRARAICRKLRPRGQRSASVRSAMHISQTARP